MGMAGPRPSTWHRSKTGKAQCAIFAMQKVSSRLPMATVKLVKIYYDGYNPAYTRDPIPGLRIQIQRQITEL